MYILEENRGFGERQFLYVHVYFSLAASDQEVRSLLPCPLHVKRDNDNLKVSKLIS